MREEKDVVEIIEAMGKFMKQTNEVLQVLTFRTDNLQLDIEKLKKDFMNYKNNGKRILV